MNNSLAIVDISVAYEIGYANEQKSILEEFLANLSEGYEELIQAADIS